MVLYRTLLSILFLVIFLGLQQEIRANPLFIQTGRKHLEEKKFNAFFELSKSVGFFKKEQASPVLEEMLGTCCPKDFLEILDAEVERGDEGAYFCLGLLCYLGSSKLKQGEDRIKAGAIFLELMPHRQESENKYCNVATHLLLQMNITTDETNKIFHSLEVINKDTKYALRQVTQLEKLQHAEHERLQRAERRKINRNITL